LPELPFDSNCPDCRWRQRRYWAAGLLDEIRLVVVDTNHNRLLIWNRIPV